MTKTKRLRSKDTATYERQVATGYAGGKRIAASGSRPLSREESIASRSGAFGTTMKSTTDGADVITDVYLIDQKRSEGASIGVKRDVLRDLCAAASRQNKVPLLQLTFTLPTGHPNRFDADTQDNWVLMPKKYFDRLDAALNSDVLPEEDV